MLDHWSILEFKKVIPFLGIYFKPKLLNFYRIIAVILLTIVTKLFFCSILHLCYKYKKKNQFLITISTA